MRTALAMILVLFAGALAGVPLAGAPEVAAISGQNPTLHDLEWLIGSWHGEGLGGEVDEHWTAASGGTMMGAFRLVIDGELSVIEYMMITEEENRIVYRFKHFNADYTTWEDDRPLEFTLISASGREAVFHSEVAGQDSPRRITYRLAGEANLVVVVAGSDEQGNLTDSFEVRFSRR